MTDSIPAATVIVFRAACVGPPLLLLVERAGAMAFAPGALVFPGGRVDPADRLLASVDGQNDDDAAARVAAIRETIEETGIAVGVEPPPPPDQLVEIRRSLHAGAPLSAALAGSGSSWQRGALVPFARWRPDQSGMRNFDTRFYLAEVAADAPTGSIDATENVRLLWATAAQVLAEADAGRVTIIYPTRRTLERLARFSSFADAVADARAHPIEVITPYVERRGNADWLCIPPGLGYPVTAEPLSSVRRG